jgi:SM-20-related protein
LLKESSGILNTIISLNGKCRMILPFSEFHPDGFSFADDPVLVLQDFWSPEERTIFREAMAHSKWITLSDMPPVAQAFPNCGNWLKAEIGTSEAAHFIQRVGMSCIAAHVESFPNIKGRHVNFNYYSYGAGDCLSTHDDTDDIYSYAEGRRPPTRRLALATYFHEEWHPDWGGELIMYGPPTDSKKNTSLQVTHCIPPLPGSLAIFAVPRQHRVCRVDPLAGDHKRLSIAGWFMTEH